MPKCMPKTRRSAKLALALPLEAIERRIYLIRGQRVMLAVDLGHLYQVPTNLVNLAVPRNRDRFPEDFLFQLTRTEFEAWRWHIAPSIEGGPRQVAHASP